KLHPLESEAAFRALAARYGVSASRIMTGSLYELLLASDLVACTFSGSAVLLEVAAVGKPLILVEPSPGYIPSPLDAGGLVHNMARDAAGFLELLDRFLAGEPVNHLDRYE